MNREDFEKVIKEKEILLSKLTKLIEYGITIDKYNDIEYRVLEDFRLGGFILKDFKCEQNKLKVIYETTWEIETYDFPYSAIENEEAFKQWIIETSTRLKIFAEREKLLQLKEQQLKEKEKEQQEKELYLRLKEKYEGVDNDKEDNK